MKKLLLLLLVLLLSVSVLGSCGWCEETSADTEPKIEIQFLNSSEKTIKEIRFFPSDPTPGQYYRYGFNHLKYRPLRSGRFFTIECSGNFRYWSLSVRFLDGGKKEWSEIDISYGFRQLEITSELKLRYNK